MSDNVNQTINSKHCTLWRRSKSLAFTLPFQNHWKVMFYRNDSCNG